MFLNEEKFLDIFKNTEKLSFDKFYTNFKVKTSNKILPLSKYKINKVHTRPLYEHIIKKNEYLKRFYETSLDFSNDISIKEKAMTSKKLDNNEQVKYKNIIRNMHFKEILKNTHSGFENNPTYLNILEDLYNNNVIDYKLLTPSALYYIKENRIGSVFSSFYFRASILNPYLVYSLNHCLLKGTKIFTPTLGWSSYCYGFLECPYVEEYVGTDVINSVCKKTKTFAAKHYPEKKVEIFNSPSENLSKNASFIKKYTNHFDVVFFSPPYFKLELYSGKNQSTNMYRSYEEWLVKYWEATIQLCFKVLQSNGRLCYILSGYGKNLEYDLVTDMNTITSKYFTLKKIIPMQNKNVHVTNHRTTGEQIIIFEKK